MAIQPAIGPAHRKHNSYIKILDVTYGCSTRQRTSGMIHCFCSYLYVHTRGTGCYMKILKKNKYAIRKCKWEYWWKMSMLTIKDQCTGITENPNICNLQYSHLHIWFFLVARTKQILDRCHMPIFHWGKQFASNWWSSHTFRFARTTPH